MTQLSTVNSFRFPTTFWPLVAKAGHANGAAQREALGEFLSKYTAAMTSFLVYSMRLKPDRADDLLHRFFADKVLEQNLIGRANPERGRFRSFLITALLNFVWNCVREDSAAKRSPGTILPMDYATEVPDGG